MEDSVKLLDKRLIVGIVALLVVLGGVYLFVLKRPQTPDANGDDGVGDNGGDDITAHEALDLGIVDEVVANEQLEEAALQLARRLALIPATTLTGIKRILNYSIKDFKDYLAFENQELLKIVGSSEYSAGASSEF